MAYIDTLNVTSATVRHTFLKAYTAGIYDATTGQPDRSDDYGPRSAVHYRHGRNLGLICKGN